DLIVSLQNQIKILEEQLSKAPDPVELIEVRAHFEGIQRLTEEKDKQIEEKNQHIETLKIELDKAGHDKEAIQNLYNNYMLQMQTLINQKAIEAPGTKKKWWQFW
ncbi:MAG: hypothetical protein P4M12_12685, partial [Gammaproteobacteria bacterium]|nr:hypothetical protein [Gammaproteobacteria bacterium]